MHSIFSWAVGIDIPLQVTGNEKPEWVHGQNKTSTRPSISIKYEGNYECVFTGYAFDYCVYPCT